MLAIEKKWKFYSSVSNYQSALSHYFSTSIAPCLCFYFSCASIHIIIRSSLSLCFSASVSVIASMSLSMYIYISTSTSTYLYLYPSLYICNFSTFWKPFPTSLLCMPSRIFKGIVHWWNMFFYRKMCIYHPPSCIHFQIFILFTITEQIRSCILLQYKCSVVHTARQYQPFLFTAWIEHSFMAILFGSYTFACKQRVWLVSGGLKWTHRWLWKEKAWNIHHGWKI